MSASSDPTASRGTENSNSISAFSPDSRLTDRSAELLGLNDHPSGRFESS